MRGTESDIRQRQKIGAARRSLGRQLRTLRLASGLSYEEMRARGLPTRSRWNRIELAQTQADQPTVAWACDKLGASPELKDSLVQLAGVGAQETWWEERSRGLPTTPGFTMLVEMESLARDIRIWGPILVPGLLQTPAYQRATFDVAPGMTMSTAERLAAIRTTRQKDTIGSATLRVILDESVLRRQVGGEETMREQIEFLASLDDRGDIEIRVLLYEVGVHRGSRGEFTLMSFAPETGEPPFYYGEGYRGVETSSDPVAIEDIGDRFDFLLSRSISLKEHL